MKKPVKRRVIIRMKKPVPVRPVVPEETDAAEPQCPRCGLLRLGVKQVTVAHAAGPGYRVIYCRHCGYIFTVEDLAHEEALASLDRKLEQVLTGTGANSLGIVAGLLGQS